MGGADFYHSCWWQDHNSTYCLYGHVTALYYLSRFSQTYSGQLARHASRLFHRNLCLDYMESAPWGITFLEIMDVVQAYNWPTVNPLYQTMGIGGQQTTGLRPADPDTVYIFELGLHFSLSREPVAALEKLFPRLTFKYENFLNPYRGRAEVFQHPFPRDCSPHCPHQQESVPYTFPVADAIDEVEEGFVQLMRARFESKLGLQPVTIGMCSIPIYYCKVWARLDVPIFGYFGLPLHYMVPTEKWGSWLEEFAELERREKAVFLANNRMLQQQVLWQVGIVLRVQRPLSLHLETTYYPSRMNEVLVPEPREGCVLHCLLDRFIPEDYPLVFKRKHETDRRLETFAQFRAVALWPHDLALIMFYEMYALTIPLFVPKHYSKYIFPYSASVPLLDSQAEGRLPNISCVALEEETGSFDPDPARPCRPPHSPLALVTSAALEYFVPRFTDYFRMPHVQLFPTIPDLLEGLVNADMQRISAGMGLANAQDLLAGRDLWTDVLQTLQPAFLMD